MRVLAFLSLFLLFQWVAAQDDFLAKQYFNDGDFEKAVVFYEKLAKRNPRSATYTQNLVNCYQQLEQYTEAEEFLLKRIQGPNVYPTIFIELGYNYSLQKKEEKAVMSYETALTKINENPNLGFSIGTRFQQYTLLEYAIKAYSKAMDLNPELNYNFQLARIYGEQGNIGKMYESYLLLMQEGRSSKPNVLRNINDFITENPENENNITLKKILLTKAQKNPDLLWNELLSWLFVQQKQYNSAFSQEKAIYKRDPESSLQRLVGLGDLAMEDNGEEVAQKIFEYVVANSKGGVTQLKAQLKLIDLDLRNPNQRKLSDVQKKFEELIATYGYKARTLQLQIDYANFLTFKKDTPEPALAILDKVLELPLNKFGKAHVKMALGNILVYHKKFNRALIYFSQIQKDLKNDVIGQNARFKVAQTSFYKGDFDWALTQLKVLRGSTSQLIANDAMQLSLLISDNSLEDSTQTALKKYARADLLAYQNKKEEAITILNDILENHKGEKVEDEALLRQAELLTQSKNYEAAELNYLKIVEFYPNDILADDALFALGELYSKALNEPEKAKSYYEKIIYNHQDSYYFPQARKNYRRLRGDTIN